MKHADKLLHLVAGACITLTFGLAHPILGLAVCLVIAWLKEEHDRLNPESHTRDGWDAYATAAGAVPGQMLLQLQSVQALSAALWAGFGLL